MIAGHPFPDSSWWRVWDPTFISDWVSDPCLLRFKLWPPQFFFSHVSFWTAWCFAAWPSSWLEFPSPSATEHKKLHAHLMWFKSTCLQAVVCRTSLMKWVALEQVFIMSPCTAACDWGWESRYPHRNTWLSLDILMTLWLDMMMTMPPETLMTWP